MFNRLATFTCPCGMVISDHKMVNVAHDLKIGDVMLCGGCGRPSIVELTGLRYMTDEEFNEMTPEEQKDLNFAQRAIKRQLRNN